jgi:glycosyltransferase involved in cell wall biosynthesis
MSALKKVSFVIPTYNCGTWLPHAVGSCLEQTHKAIEVVIVDDCSTDTLTAPYLAWLLKQNDKRVVYHRNEKNMGRSESRNIGNRLATGEVICVLDADDLAVKTRAEWTLKKMKTCQVCYGAAIAMDAIGQKLYDISAKPVSLRAALETKVNGIVHSTMAYTKELAEKYQYKSGQIADLGLDDWELQLRMLADGVSFDFIPDTLAAYRVLASSVTNTRSQEAVNKAKESVIEELKCKA